MAAPAAQAAEGSSDEGPQTRNIGISAHIDSGKTTLTERVLFYTGRIDDIHEVRGKDGVGAKMDSMELEREKGITIQSAATYCRWGQSSINIIDTPGHVDFTIEVERALRVLDGAVLVVCSVGGVQSQTITVDRQMRRYGVPRLIFINKCDRAGANPARVAAQIREKLRINCAAVQLPIGLEADHEGVVDLVQEEAVYFRGAKGETVERAPVPSALAGAAADARQALVECVAEVDDEVGELFLQEEPVPAGTLASAIRRACISLDFSPVFMGSAFKNKGVQPLLDAVIDYLPGPMDVPIEALDLAQDERPVRLEGDPKKPLVALAFKLEEGKFGQLTYLRVYEGTISKGDTIINTSTGKKVKVPRLVRMHSNELEDIPSAKAGEIVALFGVDCSSGTTFTDGAQLAMTSIKVPTAVMSLAVAPKARDAAAQFSKALQRFQKEDPTFRVSMDKETGQTVCSGMGELHLEIYMERMRREYKVDTEYGKPRVNFREAITQKAPFDYLHKKQSGGSGQYGRVVGYLEPLEEGQLEEGKQLVFENGIVGNAIPPGFIAAIEKGFHEAANAGSLIGHPVQGFRVVLTDGNAHAVDSSEMAFKLAALHAFRQAYRQAGPVVLEPVMNVGIEVPTEFQGNVIGSVNRRKGVVMDSSQELDTTSVESQIPLNNMFGYSTDLRSMTQGKGEFTMEYSHHAPVPRDVQEDLASKYEKKQPLES